MQGFLICLIPGLPNTHTSKEHFIVSTEQNVNPLPLDKIAWKWGDRMAFFFFSIFQENSSLAKLPVIGKVRPWPLSRQNWGPCSLLIFDYVLILERFLQVFWLLSWHFQSWLCSASLQIPQLLNVGGGGMVERGIKVILNPQCEVLCLWNSRTFTPLWNSNWLPWRMHLNSTGQNPKIPTRVLFKGP